jgi:HPt (histidine-containing phosphotransfer) domain-containing protein
MAQEARQIPSSPEAPRARLVRPIDLVHLAKQCLGDEHLEYEILRLFDTTLVTYTRRLETGSEVAQTLHSIKGAATGVGAWAVADAARAGEREWQESGALSPESLSDLALTVEEVRSYIARVLSNEPA